MHVDYEGSHEELPVKAQTFAVEVLLENRTQAELCLPSEHLSENSLCAALASFFARVKATKLTHALT